MFLVNSIAGTSAFTYQLIAAIFALAAAFSLRAWFVGLLPERDWRGLGYNRCGFFIAASEPGPSAQPGHGPDSFRLHIQLGLGWKEPDPGRARLLDIEVPRNAAVRLEL
jgi:hypothetical protein